MRELRELVDVEDPAWPALAAAIRDAGPRAHLLPIEPGDGERCLTRLQVTARSTLGALALHAGGVLVDGGWLRVLGGGHGPLLDLATANGLAGSSASAPPPVLLVAFDVLGGRFAINGGGLEGAPGEVHYWGPDVLTWQPLGVGHSDFVHWSLGGGLGDLYAELRWPGWRDEIAQVGLDEGVAVYPPLCTAESRPIGGTSRRPVPWAELTAQLDELARLPDGEVRFVTGE